MIDTYDATAVLIVSVREYARLMDETIKECEEERKAIQQVTFQGKADRSKKQGKDVHCEAPRLGDRASVSFKHR